MVAGIPDTSRKDPGGDAPNFALYIGDKEGRLELASGVRALIQSLEYESAEGIADLFKLVIADPPNEQGVFPIRESKLFAPGNEMSISFGYGAQLSHVGRAIIRRVRPIFPQDGVPTIEVIGYTKDMMMSDSKPEPLKERKKKRKRNAPVEYKNSTASQRFANVTYADAVIAKAEEWGMIADVDKTGDAPSDFIQKAGMSDYDFVRGLSNLCGFYFWVDGDEEGEWTLHFKNPETIQQSVIQEKTYKFRYNYHDSGTLLNFEPELAIQEQVVKFKATSKDPDSGKLFEVTIEETQNQSPDVKVVIGDQDSTTAPSAPTGLTPDRHKLDKDYSSASDVKLFLGDFSFDIRANRRFRDEEDLARWAVSWFRRQRDNFLLGRASIIGIENLRARQEHWLEGVGIAFNGKYFFTRVRHIFGDGGYTCDCSVRKIITQQTAAEEIAEAQDLGDVEQ